MQLYKRNHVSELHQSLIISQSPVAWCICMQLSMNIYIVYKYYVSLLMSLFVW